MFFAAKAAAERQARRRAYKEELARIRNVLAERGMPLTPEQIKVLAGEGDNR